jgi:small subunit ribosomal protein S20
VANIKSQIKRNRQNESARQRNKAVRSKLKTEAKRFHAAVASGDAGAAEEAFTKVAQSLDKAASKGVIHANNAANKKSRFAKRLHAM